MWHPVDNSKENGRLVYRCQRKGEVANSVYNRIHIESTIEKWKRPNEIRHETNL